MILVDFFMSVQGCGQTQSLTTEAAHILLCSAFVHFLVLHECSLHGIFLWTLIASELFLFIWCLFGAKLILFAQASGNMFLLALFAAKCPITLGTPQWGVQAMVLLHMPPDHQLSMCQKCTGAGASFCAGSRSAYKLCIYHCLLTFYYTQNIPTPPHIPVWLLTIKTFRQSITICV